MRLIAIANISNGKETIGFRLLDIETKQTKDIPLNNIISVIIGSNIQIDNLEIKENIITGSNGSINRLPRIINGQLIGKSPLIIINQLGNEGYTVSDFKGTIMSLENSKVIKYAKENGIANGKVVSKDGKEYLSSINGEYTSVTQSTTQSKEKTERLLAKAKLLYDKVQKLDDGRLIITLNNKKGIIGASGKMIIGPECDTINGLDKDTHNIRVEEHWGRIDKQGNIMVKPIYNKVYENNKGLTKVKLADKFGLVGNDAEEVVPLKYGYIDNFSEGFAAVLMGNNHGYIDTSGNEVIPLQYIGAERFSDGLAAVRTHEGGKQGFIDKTGKLIIPHIYDGAQAGDTTSFINGKAVVRYNGKEGIIDKAGKIIVPFKYSKVRPFSDGVAAVREYTEDRWKHTSLNWGFVDETGTETISPRFTTVLDFSEGLAAFRGYSGVYGLIDKTGKIVIDSAYEEIQMVSEGLIAVCRNKRWGFINKTGKIVIKLQYLEAKPFKNGIAIVKSDRWQQIVIDKTGKVIY